MSDPNDHITIGDVLNAYRHGLFPMAESRDDPDFYWYDPPQRGQLSITELHIPQRLKRRVMNFPYDIKINTDFAAVIDGCAAAGPGRQQTWINKPIRNLFCALHEAGHAHSVEAWQDGQLVGGLYGMAIGGAFMGESMFSRARDASKICLVHLCARLMAGGFTVLDTQFINDHLLQFGAYEIPREEYLQKLSIALPQSTNFTQLNHTEKALISNYFAAKA